MTARDVPRRFRRRRWGVFRFQASTQQDDQLSRSGVEQDHVALKGNGTFSYGV